MPLTISNNSAVSSASYYLDKNQKNLQNSIKRLASGKKIVGPNEDPGTLSVVMKLNSAVSRLSGAKNNVQNGISFAEIQDGVLETVGRIVGRMAELKGMATQDPLKSSQDVESYNNEFRDLQKQLRDINKSTFNGVSLFADYAGTKEALDGSGDTKTKFKGDDTRDNIIEIFTSSQGSQGTKVSLYRGALLSALTISGNSASIANAQTSEAGIGGNSEEHSVCLPQIMDRPYPSIRVVYRWECLSRLSPMLPICGHRLVAECHDLTLLPKVSPPWRPIFGRQSDGSRMSISQPRAQILRSTQY